MLFQEIPTDFKNKMDTYFKNLFSNIQKKDNNILLLNNLLYPANIKTDHLKLKVGCDKHIEIMTELFFLLHIFHNYSKQKNFLYTISSGTILGYLSIGSILPWDDDIDIVVPYSHFRKVEDLWNNTSNKAKKIWDNNWTYKNIKINSYDIILLKLNNRNFFKLKLNINSIEKRGHFQCDIGGLDIVDENGFNGPNERAGYCNLSQEEKRSILGNNNNYYTNIFSNFEINLLKKDKAEIFCNHLYSRWKEMKHPKLF